MSFTIVNNLIANFSQFLKVGNFVYNAFSYIFGNIFEIHLTISQAFTTTTVSGCTGVEVLVSRMKKKKSRDSGFSFFKSKDFRGSRHFFLTDEKLMELFHVGFHNIFETTNTFSRVIIK